MERRKLEELNLLDDFLFQEAVTRGEKGEEFCRVLLGTILEKEIRKVKVIPQKSILGTGTEKHGIKIDAKILRSGADYHELKNVIIIMILSYDPFGKNRMVYTFENHCKEDNTIECNDGTRTIYLYTKGTEGNPSKELQNMLKYIEETTLENAADETLKNLHNYVEEIRHDEEVGINYMKAFELEMMYKEEGLKAVIETCKEFGESYGDTLIRIMEKFSLSKSSAEESMEKFWNE